MLGKIRMATLPLLITALGLPNALGAQDTTTLDTIVVTAGKTEETKKEVTSNITVIDEKAIEMSTARDLGDLMRQNGFKVYDSGGTNSSLYIRGYGGSNNDELTSRVLVLLNGNRTGTNNLATSGLENVERIEIIRGPAATQYGSAAMGGVVNIITKKGEEGFKANAEVGLGSYNLNEQKLALSGGANGFDFAAAADRDERDDYQTGAGDTWRHTRYKSKLGLDMDLGYTIEDNHRISAHFNYFKADDNQAPGSGWPDTRAYPNQFGMYDKSVQNTTLKYEGSTESDLVSWLGSYTFGKYEINSQTYEDPNVAWATIVYPNVTSTRHSATDLDQAQLQTTFDNQLLSLTAGFDYVKYALDTSSHSLAYGALTTDKGESKDYGGYLISKLRLLGETLILSAGGRYDSYKFLKENTNNKENNFSPSVGIAWLPVDLLKLRANYSEGFAVPSPTQVFGDSSWYVPNTNLKPEKSKNFEIGADLSWEFIDAGLTYFYSKYTDKLVGVSSVAVPGKYTYENLEGAILAGFEFSFSADLGKALEQDFELRPYLNLTVMTQRKNKDKRADFIVPQDTDIMPYTPKLTGSYGLSFNQPEIDLSANLNASYFGKNYSKDFNYLVTTPTANQYVKYGGFTVVDLSLVKRIWDFEDKGRLSLRGEINNLFDKDYAYTMDYPMPGRSFYLGLAYAY